MTTRPMNTYWEAAKRGFQAGRRRVRVRRMRPLIAVYATVKGRKDLAGAMEKHLIANDLDRPKTEEELLEQLEWAFAKALQGT